MEHATASAALGSLSVSGGGDSYVAEMDAVTSATYSQVLSITGPISGEGTLYLLYSFTFGAMLDQGYRPTALNFWPSIGSGGVSILCAETNCPQSTDAIEFAIPFTYGVPFT